MKLALAVTLGGLQGLGSTEDGRERPVDRLHALGAAIGPVERRKLSDCERGDHAAMESFLCSLGVDLISLKFANRAAAKDDAEDKLTIALGWKRWGLKLRRGQYERVARCAIMEWVFDLCITCRGAKEIPDQEKREGAQRMKSCTECGMTGLRRYSDHERAEAMGEAYAKAMGWAHSLIASSESLAVRSVKARLERL